MRYTFLEGGQLSKDIAQMMCDGSNFKRVEVQGEDGDAALLESYSSCSFATTHARRLVASEMKGCLRKVERKGYTSDNCDDVKLRYPNSKVADKL